MYTKRIFTLFILVISYIGSLQAQEKTSFHQSFELTDSTNIILIELNNEYEYEFWAGNTILVQTEIELYNASKAVLSYFKEQGRYTIDSYTFLEEIKLVPQDSIQEPIQTKRGECFEIIKTKILLPDTFSPVGDNMFGKPVKEDE